MSTPPTPPSRNVDRRRRPAARAFTVFTERDRHLVKPREHNLLEAPTSPRWCSSRASAATIYDRGTDGSECRWARVLAYEPPDRVVFSWDINPHWQIETDPEQPARSRCASSPRRPTAPASSSSTATSTATATAGRRCATPSASPDGWALYLERYADLV